MKFGFDHVHLVGSDLDASEQFYRDKFGAETIARRDANGTVNLMMRLDGINLRNRSTAMARSSAIRTTTSGWSSRTCTPPSTSCARKASKSCKSRRRFARERISPSSKAPTKRGSRSSNVMSRWVSRERVRND